MQETRETDILRDKIPTQTQSMAEDEDIEIDLRQLFFEFKRKLVFIILAGVICAGMTGAFTKLVLDPVYTSTSMMYILTKETMLTSLTDLQIGSQLTEDYSELIMSRTVMESVIDDLGLDLMAEELEDKLTIENPADTRILYISVEDEDPLMAKTIVDEVTANASEYIADIMEMDPPKTIELGEIPELPTGPNLVRNVLIGGVVGVILVMGVITMGVIFNDSVQTEDDVLRYLDLPVLAAIPESRDIASGSRRKDRSGRHKRKDSGVKEVRKDA